MATYNEKSKETMYRWRQKNPERYLNVVKKWQQDNREKYNEYDRNRKRYGAESKRLRFIGLWE